MNQPTFPPFRPSTSPAQPDTDMVLDFGKIFSILRHGWWIVAGAGFGGALIAAVIVLQVQPTYSATAQLLMGKTSRTGDVLGALVQDLTLDDDAIAGEIAIITSGRLLSEVSKHLGLSSRPEFNADLRPPEPEPFVLMRAADQAVDGLKRLIGAGPPPRAEPVEVLADGEAAVPDPIDSAAQLGEASLGDQGDYVGQVTGGLRVRQVGNTDLVNVQFISTDPKLAAAIANAVVDIYLDDQLERKFAALRRLTEGLETRLSNMRERLEVTERAVIDYRTRALTDGLADQAQLDQHLADLSRRLGQATAERAEHVSELAAVDTIIAARGASAAAGLFESDPIERMRSQIIELRQRQGALLERSTPESSAVRNVDTEIARLENMIAAEVRRLRDDQANRLELSNARVAALRDELRALEAQAIAQAEQEVRLAQLERGHAAQQAVYGTFLDKFTETSESLDLQEGDAQVIAYAKPPAAPVAPDKKVAVGLGGVAGGFLGTGLVFLLALTDHRIRNKSQFAAMLPGAPVITLPRTGGGLFRRADPLAVASRAPQGALVERVRAIRSQLMLSEKKGPGRMVAVTSTRADTCKMTTSLLLARSIAEMGISCLVVDADLRRAGIAGQLKLPEVPDLVDVLLGTVPLDDALQTDPGSDASILAGRKGAADPAGVLLSDAMGALVMDLRQRFRVVIINAAPLMPVPDAAPMIKMADNVVFMVRYGTPEQEVEAGLEALNRLSMPQLSVVLSHAPRRSDRSYDRYDIA